MLALFWAFGTLDFQGWRRRSRRCRPIRRHLRGATVLTGATLLLFLGATGKSAQLPLYVWLPDAMEGPTPVSALIHAATMVTAGVYMIGRNAVLFSHAPFTLEVDRDRRRASTALFAGTIGLVQNDIKRVLAYSTVSQLGYMFLAMGVGAFAGGIFHLYTHAFFKALLFLGSGAVIHALHGEQDIRNMGGLQEAPADHVLDVPHRHDCDRRHSRRWPASFPRTRFSGRRSRSGHTVLWLVAVVAAFLTATYMFRLLYMTFFGERQSRDAEGTERSEHTDARTAPHGRARSSW